MLNQIDLAFGDGEYTFRLPFAACAEIERKADATISQVYSQLMLGEPSAVAVVEVIRQGLIGGKMGYVDGQVVETKPHIVNALLDRYVTGDERQPFIQSCNLAQVIMHGFMMGYDDKKKEPTEPVMSEST
jgi:Phage tail tube protein, GTA-gp10